MLSGEREGEREGVREGGMREGDLCLNIVLKGQKLNNG